MNATNTFDSTFNGACGSANASFCLLGAFLISPVNMGLFLLLPYVLSQLHNAKHSAASRAQVPLPKVLLASNVVQALVPLVLVLVAQHAGEIKAASSGSILWILMGIVCWGLSTAIVVWFVRVRETTPIGLCVWWLFGFTTHAALVIWDLATISARSSFGFLDVLILLDLVNLGIPAFHGIQILRHQGANEGNSPCERANLWDRLMFSWLNGLMSLGYRRPLEFEDMHPLDYVDTSTAVGQQFFQHWDIQMQKPHPSVARALIAAFGPTFFAAAGYKFLYDLLQFVGPVLLNAMVSYIQDENNVSHSVMVGYGYVIALAVSSVVATLVLHQYFFKVFRVGQQLRSAVILAVYRKALRLTVGARQNTSVGQIVNIMSTDAQRMQDLTTYLMMLWSAPLQIGLSLYFLWGQLGAATLSGCAVMILFTPISSKVATHLKTLQQGLMKVKDKRVNLTNECLNGIKFIKLSAWEGQFMTRIRELRESELAALLKYKLVNFVGTMLWVGLPLLVSLASFATYALMGNELTPARVFTALSLFNILRFPMTMFPRIISSLIEASVSVGRISRFLDSQEVSTSATLRLGNTDTSAPAAASGSVSPTDVASVDTVISVRGGYYHWPQAAPALNVTKPSWFSTMSKNVRTRIAAMKASRSSAHQNLDDESSMPTQEMAPVAPAGAGTGTADDPPERPAAALSDIDLQIKRGQLVVVVGPVASGKSSLLMALLGEMAKDAGSAMLRGSVSYVAQSAFILNCSLKDNILFGKPYDEARYRSVIDMCCLQPDLDILPAGDATEIGERGINLSGGQRQRVSIARAVYADPDVLLLDDALSAVDAHVGNRIFGQCILRGMTGKTRVLVTHGLQYAFQADLVLVMSAGRIVERGTYQQLLGRPQSVFGGLVQAFEADGKQLAAQISAAQAASPAGSASPASVVAAPKATKAAGPATATPGAGPAAGAGSGGKLVNEESRSKGSVGWDVFHQYAQAVGGYGIVSLVILAYAAQEASTVATNYFLSWWAEQGPSDNAVHLGEYTGVVLVSMVILALMGTLMSFSSVRAARVMHQQLLSRVLFLPMSFFDTTPIGRVLNRFSQDVYNVDETLPEDFGSCFRTGFSVLSTVIVIAVVTPWFLTVVVPLGAVYVFTQRYFVSTARELRRLDSVSRSPIYSHFGETLAGTVTVRAYGHAQRFIDTNSQKLDRNQQAYFMGTASNRWLAVRLEMLGTVIVVGSALFAVIGKGSVSPALAGLSLSYALSVTQALNWMVRMSSQIEAHIVAVERIHEYAALLPEPTVEREPSQSWPTAGAISIHDLVLHYRANLPAVLNGVSCEIRAGEKVGICGRTGAGKSSLISALFCLADVQTGELKIDGVDIATLSRTSVRSRLAIIPQETTLFSGTLRRNLDPLSNYTDSQLYEALELVGLRQTVSALKEGLESAVAENAENWSHGQRQLICMARALLRHCKVVVLDEATASCDVETDALLQRTIRRVFADCTVLTIAHRVHTILDSDRIMVLDAGRVVEFDKPATLAADPSSVFAHLMAESAAATQS